MPGNYYLVLGLERGADLPQIKRAYRQAIKRYHPDRGGSGTDADKFMQAREAYEVLSDADRRRAYDASLYREGIPVHLTDARWEAMQRRRAWRAPHQHAAAHLEAFFEGLIPEYFGRHRRRSIMDRDRYMEVVLTPEEARRGGTFPVAVPVWQPCPGCSGGWAFCPTCRGRGTVRARREFNLVIPPNVGDGTSAAVSLEAIGLRGVRLVIEIRVRADPTLRV
jgi:molecular chaperone DnaJ